MTGYELTAGQQQLIVDFLNAGNGIYLEGTDFGSHHYADPVYAMFGLYFLATGATSYNVQYLVGQEDTLLENMTMNYTYGNNYPDLSVDYFYALGADTLSRCQSNNRRISAFSGENGTYRTIHSAIWFGAMIEAGSSHTKAEVMAAYIRYLSGDTLVSGLDDGLKASAASTVNLFLEIADEQAGREFAILGSVTGTTPGFNMGPVHVPLNFDPFTDLVISMMNSPVFKNFHGDLDGNGRALASLNAPVLDPSYVGLSMDFAFLLVDPWIDYASNPVNVTIVP